MAIVKLKPSKIVNMTNSETKTKQNCCNGKCETKPSKALNMANSATKTKQNCGHGE